MSGSPELKNSLIDLVQFREAVKTELVRVLNVLDGKKALVLDQSLVGPLGLISEVDLIKKQGVGKIHYLTNETIDTDAESIIYLTRTDINRVKLIADQIRNHKDLNEQHDYGVFFVPRKTILCERVLVEQGVRGDCKLGAFQLDLIPFDDDVLSLEMPNAFPECFLEGDPTALFHCARAMMRIQEMFGTIPNIKGKGDNAYKVFQHMQRMRRETATPLGDKGCLSAIDTLLIIDRTTDCVTPMLHQMTYEGLIDEQFGIKNTYIDVAAELVGTNQNSTG